VTHDDAPPARRRLRLLLWAVIAIALIAVCARARFANDLTTLLPSDHPVIGRELAFFAERGAAQVMAVEAWPLATDADPLNARRLLAELAPRLAAVGARPLRSGDPAALARLADVVHRHLPTLLDADQQQIAASRLDGDGLHAALAALGARARRPDDQFTGSAARRDPLGLAALAVADAIGGIAGPGPAHLPAAPAADGVVVHADGRHALLLLAVDFPPDDLARGRALLDTCATAAAEAGAAGVVFEVIGGYRHFRENLDGIQSDLWASLPVSLIAIAVLLASLVRSTRALIAVHLPMLLSLAAAVALLVIAGRSVPTMMIGFAAAFLGISVENSIHMAMAVQRGDQHLVRKPLLVSYLTTAVAFAVLIGSTVPALRWLGLLVAVGLLVALSASLWLVPLLVERRPQPPPWQALSRHLLAWAEGPARPRWALALVISTLTLPGLFALPVFGHRGLVVLDDLRRMDGSRPETWAALADFQTRWGGFEASDFLVAADAEVEVALARVAAARQRLDLPPSLVERLLPAAPQRRARLAGWNALWTQRPAFAAEFAASARARGLRPAAFTEALARYAPADEASGPQLADWKDTPIGDVLTGMVHRRGDGLWQVAAPLSGADAESIAQRLTAADGVWVASRTRLARHLVTVVREDLAGRFLVMGATMALLVFIAERRLRTTLAVLLPPALALGWTFGLLAWFGVPLTPFSVIVAAFVAGIGLDGAIFLADPEHRAAALPPVLACSATATIGVGSLTWADNPLLANAGCASLIGMIACLVAALLLTPLIAGRRPRPR